MQNKPIHVAIIEDDQTIRDGYTYLINNEPGYYVCGAYAQVEDALPELAKRSPQVILLDIELPGMNGIEAIPHIRKAAPGASILMLTVYEDADNIFRALSQGAVGYLTKSSPARRIMDGISEVVAGGAPMSIGVARLVIQSFHRNRHLSPLTDRETEILELVASGKSRSKIADELFIEVETVKSHIKNIYAKLDVHSRDEAIQAARDRKYI